MKLNLLLPIFLTGSFAFAQSGTIKKVQGKEAIVEFNNYAPKAGESFNIEKGLSFSNPGSESGLRKRNHGMSWEYTSSITKSNDDSGETKITNGQLNIGYNYNWGRFEFGPFVGATISKKDEDKSSVSEFGINGQLNLIENVPGNDVVPYLRVALSSLSFRSDSTTGSTSHSNGSTGLGVGMLWFPLSEIFSLDVNLSVSRAKVSDVELTVSSLSAGWRFYF